MEADRVGVSHSDEDQVVSPSRLRRILAAQGETCYCAPANWDANLEWDPGYCPEHQDWCRAAGIGDYWHPGSGVPHPDDEGE